MGESWVDKADQTELPLAGGDVTEGVFDLPEVGRRRAEAVVASLSGREPSLSFTAVDPQLIQRSST